MPKRPVPLETVFIVEDEAILAMGLEDALMAQGAGRVHSFALAKDALAALQSITPGLLIIDLHLADSHNGHGIAEVASQICNPIPHLIFATAEPDRLPAELMSAGRVFAKPYDPAELAAYAAAL